MPLSLNDLLKEFGATNEEELLAKRTKEKAVKVMPLIEAPRRVEMTADQCKKLCDKVGLRYATGYEGRVIERVTTTESADRYGDIVRAKGIDNTNYRKNPVVLFAHDHGDFPVGKSLKEWIDKNINGWRSWDLYFGDEIDTSGRSDLTFRMVDSGAMPGGSIGFIPGDAKADHSPEERNAMGLGRYGVEYLTCEKLEHSACSIPANPEALSNCLKSIESKRLKAMFAQSDVDKMVAEKMLDEDLADIFASILGVQRTISLPPAPPALPIKDKGCDSKKPMMDDDNDDEEKEKKSKSMNFTINLDVSQAHKELAVLNENIQTINSSLENITKSFENRIAELMAATQRALTALESKSKTTTLYDRKELEDALRIPKKI